MTGVKPRTSGIESDRSTNWATTTSHGYRSLCRANGALQFKMPPVWQDFLLFSIFGHLQQWIFAQKFDKGSKFCQVPSKLLPNTSKIFAKSGHTEFQDFYGCDWRKK